jgi:hypothetical protein
MSTRNDPLLEHRRPDRLFFATGMLLDQKDFEDEQTYHRNRLARSLAYLHGGGTVAGLRVKWEPPVEEGEDPQLPEGREGQLAVEAGLAIDRLGRLIEVPRNACIRLKRWYDEQEADQLNTGFHSAFYQGVVVDLFIRFVACERGKTPAFASGPFDATNAAVPSRVRDAYELKLFIRQESDEPLAPGENRVPLQQRLPVNPWPDLAAITDPDPNVAAGKRREALREAVFNAWLEEGEIDEKVKLPELAEHVRGQDPAFLFLARIVIPATAGGANQPPVWDGAQVEAQNEDRLFVYTPNALARALGL